MLSLTGSRNWRVAFALSVAFNVMIAQVADNGALATVDQSHTDPVGDQLRNQLDDVVNTPLNFCDGATESTHQTALITAIGKLQEHQSANHHPGPGDVKYFENKAVQANKADGGDLVEDLPYVTDYENAERRGDVKAQKELFAKMTPAAQAQAAQWDNNSTLAIKLLTPLADAGDVRSQLSLAGIYNFGTTGASRKYAPMPDAKVREIMKKVFPHWPGVDPPENLPLAYKYYRMAAEKGNFFGQSQLARAYACGFGTERNLVFAYMWFSLSLAQRDVTTQMSGASLPWDGSQKKYALDRDFIAAQMKPEEIEQAKLLLTQCLNRRYKNCD